VTLTISQQLTYNMYIRAMYACDKYIHVNYITASYLNICLSHTLMTSSALSEINMTSLLLF